MRRKSCACGKARIRRERRAALPQRVVGRDQRRHLCDQGETGLRFRIRLASAQRRSPLAPSAETAVRRASIGCAVVHECQNGRQPGLERSRPAAMSMRSVAKLGPGRQLAIEQQPDDFLERGVVGEIIDVVAAIFEPAVVAVDSRDRAAVEVDAVEAAMDARPVGPSA